MLIFFVFYKKYIIKQEGLVLRKTEASQRISFVFRMCKIVKEKRRKKQYEFL